MQKRHILRLVLVLVITLLIINAVTAFSLKNWLTGFIAYDLETQKCQDLNNACKKNCFTPYTSCVRTCDAQTSTPDMCITNCNTQSTSCSSSCRQTYSNCAAAVRAGTTGMTLTTCDQNARTCSNTCVQAKNSCTASCSSGFNITACKNTCTESENSCNQENKICDDQFLACKQQVEQQYPPKDCPLENMKHSEFKCKTTRILQQCIDGTLTNTPCNNGCNSVQNICNAPITSAASTITTTPSTRPSTRQPPSSQTTVSPTVTQQERLKKQIDQLLASKQAGRITDDDFVKSIQRSFPGLNLTNITIILNEISQGIKTFEELKQALYAQIQIPPVLQPDQPVVSEQPASQPASKSDIEKRLNALLLKKNEGKISEQAFTKSLLGLFPHLDNETLAKLIAEFNNGVANADSLKESLFKSEEELKQQQQTTDKISKQIIDETIKKTVEQNEAIKSFDEVFQDLVGSSLTDEQLNEEIKKLLPQITSEQLDAFKNEVKEGSLTKEDLKKKIEELKSEILANIQENEELCSVTTNYGSEDLCYQQVIADDDACCTGEQGWDEFCENSYQACADPESFNDKVCPGAAPYTNENTCYIETIKLDVMCCDDGWDEFCQEEYDELLENGDCEEPEGLPTTEDDELILDDEWNDETDEDYDQYDDYDFDKDNEFDTISYEEEDFTVPDVFGFDVDIDSEFEDNLDVERIRGDFEFDPESEGIGFESDLDQQASEETAEEAIYEETEQTPELLEQLEQKEELEIQKRLANNRFVVIKTEGDSNVRLGKNQHRILEKGTSLAQGSRLQTGALGTIILATNELKIRAEPSSKLEIKKIKQKKTSKELGISLEYGLVKINKNKNALSKVILETPNAIIEINGGVEVLYDLHEKKTIIKVADGSALVKSKVESKVTEVYKNTETEVKGTPNIVLRFAYFIKG